MEVLPTLAERRSVEVSPNSPTGTYVVLINSIEQ